MKILNGNAGALTNFEVLDFLRSRGAGKDPTRVIVPVAPSEFKVYDYLETSASCNQTRECIREFFGKCKVFNLTRAEISSIINLRPTSSVELNPIVSKWDERMSEDDLEKLAELVEKALPPPPNQTECDDGNEEEKEENLQEEGSEM